MTTRIIACIFFAVAMASCNNSDTQAGEKETSTGKKDTLHSNHFSLKYEPVAPQDKPFDGQYCYIKKMTDTPSQLEIDEVQFLLGEEALAAAKQHGEKEVLDNYYIVNADSSTKKVPLAESIEVVFVGEGESYPNTNDKLEKAFTNGLFVLTIKNGVVTKIKQQYLP